MIRDRETERRSAQVKEAARQGFRWLALIVGIAAATGLVGHVVVSAIERAAFDVIDAQERPLEW